MKHILSYFRKIIQLIFVYKNVFLLYISLLMGIILCSIFIYVKFLRYRVPKEIPFSLTEFGFYVLIFICFGYLYAVKQIIKPKMPHSFIIKIITYIITPLVILDQHTKKLPIIKLYYAKLEHYFEEKALSFGSIERAILIFLCKIIPGLLLLIIFFIDVFFVNKIEIFYFFVFLNIITIIYQYYKYCLGQLKTKSTTYLNSKYDSVVMMDRESEYVSIWERNPFAIYHDKTVSVKEYFDIQLQTIYKDYNNENSTIDYYGIPFSKEEYYLQYRLLYNKVDIELNTEDYEFLRQDFYQIEPKLLGLMAYLDLNKTTYEMYNIKKLQIMIYISYFFIWSYILYKSFHTLTDIPMTLNMLKLLTSYTIKINPFIIP